MLPDKWRGGQQWSQRYLQSRWAIGRETHGLQIIDAIVAGDRRLCSVRTKYQLNTVEEVDDNN